MNIGYLKQAGIFVNTVTPAGSIYLLKKYLTMDKLKLETVIQEDVRKLHNEINQTKNQQFILMTSALTIFGIISGWIFSKSEENSYSLLFLSTSMLYILLIFFYIYSRVLRGTSRLICAYLIYIKGSEWERHYLSFASNYKYGQGSIDFPAIQTMIFALLGGAITIYPFIFLTYLNKVPGYLVIHILLFIIYFWIIIKRGIVVEDEFSIDYCLEKWKLVISKDDSIR